MRHSFIVATGSHIPTNVVPNSAFLQREFLGPDRKKIDKTNEQILQQFEAITGIRERRYVSDDVVTSDIGTDAARQALTSSDVDPESLDLIVFAHNFGDVRPGSRRSDLVPALAARVKARLKISNPKSFRFTSGTLRLPESESRQSGSLPDPGGTLGDDALAP